jgi:hypothetical protein
MKDNVAPAHSVAGPLVTHAAAAYRFRHCHVGCAIPRGIGPFTVAREYVRVISRTALADLVYVAESIGPNPSYTRASH